MATIRQFLSSSSPLASRFRLSSTSLSSSRFLSEGFGFVLDCLASSSNGNGVRAMSSFCASRRLCLPQLNGSASLIFRQHMSSTGKADEPASHVPYEPYEPAPRIKFKKLSKTARHIMKIIDKEAVEEVKGKQEIPEIKPGYIIQLKLEVPENKRRVSTIKGIVIARRNCGLNSTIRLRRMVAGVGIESLLPLYSPNIKEIKVLERKRVRRAKLYYLRDRMNEIRKLDTLPSK